MQGCPLQVGHDLLDPIPVLWGENVLVGVRGWQGERPPRCTGLGSLQVLDGVHPVAGRELLVEKVIGVLVVKEAERLLYRFTMTLNRERPVLLGVPAGGVVVEMYQTHGCCFGVAKQMV